MAKGQKRPGLRKHQAKDMQYCLDSSFETLRTERQGLVGKAKVGKSKVKRVVTTKDIKETEDLLASMMNKV